MPFTIRARATLLLGAGQAMAGASSLRFAVCIVGQLRSLAFEPQIQNVKNMLVDNLPGTTHVFAVFDDLTDPAARQRAMQAAEELGAVSTTFLRSPPSHIDEACPWKRSGPGAESFYTQAYKVAACFEKVQAYEQLSGIEYDFVVRTRPDLGFYAPIASWLHLADNAIFTGYNHKAESCSNQQDFFAVVPRRLTGAYRSLPHAALNCSRQLPEFECARECPHLGADFGPECFLGSHLAWSGARTFGCYDKWSEGEHPEAGALRHPSLWALVRLGCPDPSSEHGWRILFGEEKCASQPVPLDSSMMKPFTGKPITTPAISKDHHSACVLPV